MSTSPKPETPAVQVNPFAFITDTNTRFFLLLVMVFAVSMSMLYGHYVSWVEGEQHFLQCFKTRSNDSDVYSMVQAELDQPLIERDLSLMKLLLDHVLKPCTTSSVQNSAPWIILCLLGILILTWLIYRLYPRWVLRHFQPAGAEINAITQAVHTLAENVGLKERPGLWLAPLDAHPGALTLISSGRHQLVLSSGLVALYHRDRRIFDAIIHHELAHIHHNDVRKIYIARALWWAFVIVTVLPSAIAAMMIEPVWTGRAPQIEGWARTLLLTALVYLTQMSIFRAREYYADAQAVNWVQGDKEPTLQALRLLSDAVYPHRPKPMWRINRWMVWLQGLRSVIRSPLSYHPSRRQREQAIREPTTLLNVSVMTAFVTALVAAILMAYLYGIFVQITLMTIGSFEHMQFLSTDFWLIIATLFVTALIPSLFMIASTGLNVWRAVFTERIRPHPRHFPALLGLATACGFVLGDLIGFLVPWFYQLDPETRRAIPAITQGLAKLANIYGLPLVVLTIGFSLVFYALRSTARAWVGVSLIAWPGRAVPYIALLLFAIVLSLGLFVIHQQLLVFLKIKIQVSELMPVLLQAPPAIITEMQIRLAEEMGNPLYLIFRAVAQRLLNVIPSTLVLTLVLIALPLLAACWQRRHINPHYASRAFYELPEPSELPRLFQIPLRPLTVLVIGIGGGVVFSLLLPLLDGIDAPPAVVQYLYLQSSPALQRLFGIVLCAALAQGLLALGVALWMSDLKVVHGLAASYSAGAVMAVGIVVYFNGQGWNTYNTPYIKLVLVQVIHSGLVLSLVLSLIGTRVQRLWLMARRTQPALKR